MKINVLYEGNIKNGHRYYTTIEVPDGDYTMMLDLDYEQRLAEADPDKKHKVKRCKTLQELYDQMNNQEFNNWRKYHRHHGNSRAQAYEDDGTGGDGDDGAVWCEPLMSEVLDDRIFRKEQIDCNERENYEDICEWVRKILKKKPKWANAFIAIRLGGISVNDYAAAIGVSDASIVSKWLARAERKLREKYPGRQI